MKQYQSHDEAYKEGYADARRELLNKNYELLSNIENAVDFKPFKTDIELIEGLKLVGYFPYEKAYVRGYGIASLNYDTFEHIRNYFHEIKLDSDNKRVYIFQYKGHTGENFAMQIHDGRVRIGNMGSITNYHGHPLKFKKDEK